jgi:branched-chain amino acid transport system permease protein
LADNANTTDVTVSGGTPDLDATLRRLHRRFPRGELAVVVVAEVILVAFGHASAFATSLALATTIGALIAVGFNIIAGFGGRLAFGNQLFFGIGAYAVAVGPGNHIYSPLTGLFIGLILSMVVAYALGRMLARVAGMLFAICTFVLALIALSVITLIPWLGGAAGFSAPLLLSNSLVELNLTSQWNLLLVGAVFVLGGAAFTAWLSVSAWGAGLMSARDDRVAAATCGVNVAHTEALAWAISAAITSLAGVLFYQYTNSITPQNAFGFPLGVEVLVPAVVGGLGTVAGPVIGSAVILLGGLLTQFSHAGATSGLNNYLYGVILILIIRLAPGGLVGMYRRFAGHVSSLRNRGTGTVAWRHAKAAAEAMPDLGNLGLLGEVGRDESQDSNPAWVPAGSGGGPVLTVRGLNKSFGAVCALQDVGFDVDPGTIVGVIGPNGSGKTTLFNCLTGVEKADRGKVVLRDHNVTSLKSFKIARLGVARTYQTVRLFDKSSVLDNVALPLLWKIDQRSARRRALAALTAVGMERAADMKPAQLSLADRRTLELARALVTEAPVIMLDEVMAGLTRDEAEHIGNLISSLSRSRGISFLVVEHVMGSLVKIAPRIVVMNFGSIICDGPAEEVLKDPIVLEAYFGRVVQGIEVPTADDGK